MRYLLFAYDTPSGGIEDLEGTYETIEEADRRLQLNSVLARDNVYLYDNETGEVMNVYSIERKFCR